MRTYSFFMTSLSPGIVPKALSWEGISLSGRKVVVIQEIEPKVRFPGSTRFVYILEVALKLLSNSKLS